MGKSAGERGPFDGRILPDDPFDRDILEIAASEEPCDCPPGAGRCAHAALRCDITGYSNACLIQNARRGGLHEKMLGNLDSSWKPYLDLVGDRFRATGALWALELDGVALDHKTGSSAEGNMHLIRLANAPRQEALF